MTGSDPSKLETVERFFSGTGFSYDRVVVVCTGGLDLYWKKRILGLVPPQPRRILDQACGTGIVTLKLARAFPEARVTGVELREEYLELAREKARAQGVGNVDFALGRAEEVLLDEEVDCIVSSYLAKYAELDLLIRNAARMLRPGGRVILHDFACPENPVLRRLWLFYLALLRSVGGRFFPEWGTVFRELPEFLVRTTWVPDTVAALERHGFREIVRRSLGLGTAALVTARKPAQPGRRTSAPGPGAPRG